MRADLYGNENMGGAKYTPFILLWDRAGLRDPGFSC